MLKAVFCSLALLSAIASARGQQPAPFLPRAGVLNSPYTPPVPFANAAAYNVPFVPILDYSNEINVDGSYKYSFVTADGKHAEEAGYLKDVSVDKNGDPVGIQVVQGSYSYTSPDGTPVQVTYIADENGFQPTSVRVPSVDGRLPGPVNPLNPLNPFASPYRNPYAAPFAGRINKPLINNYKPLI